MTTQYLLTATGRTAQDSTANAARCRSAQPISNGSDNALLDNFVLPALGCTAFTAPDLSDAAGPAPRRPWTNSPRPPASGPRSRWSRRTTR